MKKYNGSCNVLSDWMHRIAHMLKNDPTSDVLSSVEKLEEQNKEVAQDLEHVQQRTDRLRYLVTVMRGPPNVH